MPKWIWATWCHQNPGNWVNFKDQYLTHIIFLQGQGHFYNFYKFQKSHSGTAKMTLWMPCQSEYRPSGATKTPGTGSISKINTWHTSYTYKVKVTSILFIKFKKVTLARLKDTLNAVPKWIWATWCHENPGNWVNFKDQYLTHIIYLQGQVHFYIFYKFQKSHSGTAKMTLWLPCQSEYGPLGATKTPGTWVNFKDQYLTHIIYLQGQVHFYTFL